MSHDRRQFLKFSSSFLATLGISTLPIWQQSDRYARALSSTKGQKLALLVGINKYPIPSYADLKGCTTDVELQKALLVNRFGFNPNDVLTLTNDTTGNVSHLLEGVVTWVRISRKKRWYLKQSNVQPAEV